MIAHIPLTSLANRASVLDNGWSIGGLRCRRRPVKAPGRSLPNNSECSQQGAMLPRDRQRSFQQFLRRQSAIQRKT
jgi:hypothetical protein